jgi:hypothetical protein
MHEFIGFPVIYEESYEYPPLDLINFIQGFPKRKIPLVEILQING